MITIVGGVPAPSAAPLFRVAGVVGVVGGTALSSCRPVAGQECSGFGIAAARAESVSGATVAGAAQALNLRGFAGTTERAGLSGLRVTGLVREGRPEQVQQAAEGAREVLLAHIAGSDGSTDGTNGITSTTRTTSAKPMYPWDLRTSSPPG
ncbi:MAG: hypothetical protein ACJ786_04635 [Catenulispora sp.]